MRRSIGDGNIEINYVAIILVGLILIGIGISAVQAGQTFQSVTDWGSYVYFTPHYFGWPPTVSCYYTNPDGPGGGMWMDGANQEIRALYWPGECFESGQIVYAQSGRFAEVSYNWAGQGGSWYDYCSASCELLDAGSAGGGVGIDACNVFWYGGVSWQKHLDSWPQDWGGGYGCSSNAKRGAWSLKVTNDLYAEVWYNGTMVHKSPTQFDKYPLYFSCAVSPGYCTGANAQIDDVCVGPGCFSNAQVGTLPDYMYIKKDLFNQYDKGLYRNNSLVNSNTFYFEYRLPAWLNNNTPRHLDMINTETGVQYERCWTTTLSSYNYNPSGGINWAYFHVGSLTDSGAPYGQYSIKITDSSSSEVITAEGEPFWYISGGASVLWSKKRYVTTEEASVSWTVSDPYWQPDNYNYYLHITKADGTVKLQPPATITSKIGIYNVTDTSGYDAGDYWAYLGMIPKAGSSNESITAYDFTEFVREVDVEGYTLDAYNKIVLPSTAVGIYSADAWHNTTSDASTAYYTLRNLTVGNNTVQATKTNYQTNNYLFRPPSYGFYRMNISMLPNFIPNNTAIVGVTVVDWDHNAVPDATVKVWNGTWSTTTTSDSWGYYIVDNLAGGEQYSVNGSKARYLDSVTYTVNTTANKAVTQYVELPPLYTLTVLLKDATSGATITTQGNVTLQSATFPTQTGSTTTGSVDFTVQVGVYTATGYAVGYYGATGTAIVVADKTLTLDLVRSTNYSESSAAAATRFLTPPHSVRFLCSDVFGNPIQGLTVTATVVKTTLPNWGWLTAIFGVDQNVTAIENTTMTGLTDSAGGIIFLMWEDVNYQMTFKNDSQGVSETRNYYPKEDQYSEVFWPQMPRYSTTQLSYVLYNRTIDSGNMTLGLLYSDSLGHTTNLSFYVMDWNTKQILYENVTPVTPVTTANPIFNVSIERGAVYVWGFNATVTDYKKPISEDKYIRFAGQKRLISLGIEENDLTDQLYNWFAVGMIVAFGGFFGRYTLKYGMPLTALWGAFWFIAGWLMTSGLLVALAACIGVFAAFRAGQEESGL